MIDTGLHGSKVTFINGLDMDGHSIMSKSSESKQEKSPCRQMWLVASVCKFTFEPKP